MEGSNPIQEIVNERIAQAMQNNIIEKIIKVVQYQGIHSQSSYNYYGESEHGNLWEFTCENLKLRDGVDGPAGDHDPDRHVRRPEDRRPFGKFPKLDKLLLGKAGGADDHRHFGLGRQAGMLHGCFRRRELDQNIRLRQKVF